MGGFVAYIFQSSVVMTFLYLAYKWLLAPSTFHGMNVCDYRDLFHVVGTPCLSLSYISANRNHLRFSGVAGDAGHNLG